MGPKKFKEFVKYQNIMEKIELSKNTRFLIDDILCYGKIYNKNKIVEIVEKRNFNKVIDLFPEVEYIEFYNFTNSDFMVKIVQSSCEADDIIKYFREKLSKSNPEKYRNFEFISYNKNTDKSNIIFKYKLGMFESIKLS